MVRERSEQDKGGLPAGREAQKTDEKFRECILADRPRQAMSQPRRHNDRGEATRVLPAASPGR